MSLETFGWILMALGLFLFVYGYLKAAARLDVEEHSVPRVTEQEKREALAALDSAVPTWSRTALYDWAEERERASMVGKVYPL